MRDLHVVAVSADGKHLVLATTAEASRGGFRLRIDDRLRAALRGQLPAAGAGRARQTVTVRQMQSLLRTGHTIEEIAALGGVPVTKVERFAGPVLSELEAVVRSARSRHQQRARRPESVLPMGEAADAALALSGSLRPETVRWTARRTEDDEWVVVLRYEARGRRQAEWAFDPVTRTVTPLDKLAVALGYAARDGSRTQAAASPPARPPSPGRVAPGDDSGRPSAAARARQRPAASTKTAAGSAGGDAGPLPDDEPPSPPAARPDVRARTRAPSGLVRAPTGGRVLGVAAKVGRPTNGSPRGPEDSPDTAGRPSRPAHENP